MSYELASISRATFYDQEKLPNDDEIICVLNFDGQETSALGVSEMLQAATSNGLCMES